MSARSGVRDALGAGGVCSPATDAEVFRACFLTSGGRTGGSKQNQVDWQTKLFSGHLKKKIYLRDKVSLRIALAVLELTELFQPLSFQCWVETWIGKDLVMCM